MTDGFSTQAVHAGEEKRKPFGALTTPIIQTSTYTFSDTAEILGFMENKAEGKPEVRDEYGRYSNPTQRAAERKLAHLERGERALLFSSGMSAITTTMIAESINRSVEEVNRMIEQVPFVAQEKVAEVTDTLFDEIHDKKSTG